LLNGDGFWLVGPSPESEWGFQLPDRKGKNLKTEDPALWNKISAGKVGWFEDNGNLYCFKRADPVSSGTDYPPLRMSTQGDERLHWIFLTKVPDDVVWQKVDVIRKGIWETGAISVVVLVPGVSLGLFSLRRRRLDRENLRQSELLLQMAGQMSKVGAWRVEWRTRQVIWSEEVYRIHEMPFDYSPTVTDGIAFYAPDHRVTISDAFETCMAEGKPFDVEVELITATGRRLWVRVMGRAEHENGKLQRVFGTLQDITASKQALIELHENKVTLMKSVAQEQELARRAQAAERAKGEFLAVMSHEIRTPLNGVIGMTSVLADTPLNELQSDCVSTIQTSGEALLTVINDILDFSKIESGKMNLEKRSFSVAQCVEEAVDLFVVQIRKKKLETAYLIAPEVPASLIGDSNRLRQILINLLGNAIKFTERGEIIINVQCQKRDDQGFHLLFSVTDTGIGITREGIGKLFQSFQQVDSSTTRRYGGTGLGLAISKRLAELMGGTMWVESEPGAGSTFFFNAVLDAAPTLGAVGATDGPGLKSASALIVDDNDTNRRMLDAQLKAWGMTTVSVASGRDALAKLAEAKFDVVLLDLQMPGMDGVTLAREIRKSSEVPLILLSSSGEVEVGEAGNLFQHQIPKPIKQSVLRDVLEQVTGATREKKKSVTRQFDHDLGDRQPLRILLAEDNSVNQKVGTMMLARVGYRADLAGNGLQVLEAVDKAPYDLILMDVQMPEMDGIEATRRLREKLGDRCPFISALTAEALEGDRERFLGLGFDGYLSKPLSPEKLQTVLQEVSLHSSRGPVNGAAGSR
jgi:signal transduction histidine kinase/CheY-like chemotaxis protein